MSRPEQYYVYIMSNKYNDVFYIGVTNNLTRRVFEHKEKIIEGFSKKYNLVSLVYYEVFYDASNVITREKQLKCWHRDWKINLIRQIKPDLKDLYDELVK